MTTAELLLKILLNYIIFTYEIDFLENGILSNTSFSALLILARSLSKGEIAPLIDAGTSLIQCITDIMPN